MRAVTDLTRTTREWMAARRSDVRSGQRHAARTTRK